MKDAVVHNSRFSHRGAFVELIAGHGRILEIGPFDAPIVRGDNVQYFDVLDHEGLRRRAKALNRNADGVPPIDYVSPTGDLSVVDREFDAAVSCHAVEHQPDLVKHLKDIARLLDAGGKYYLLVPDKRYCFDHFIAETTLADVLQAHHECRSMHTLKSVIEHRALTTHNNAIRHWKGDHADQQYFSTIVPRTVAAQREYEAAGDNYIDVHAWQFTPASFARLVNQLFELKLSLLRVEASYETPKNRLEFMVILKKEAAVPP